MTTTAHPQSSPTHHAHGRRWRRLGLHYLEMVVALMATDMAIGMTLWMRLRRHGWPVTLQMCAAMYVPLLLLPLVATDVMGAMTFMTVAHVVMCVAMLLVLLLQPEH
jgi:hypothetical protein